MKGFEMCILKDSECDCNLSHRKELDKISSQVDAFVINREECNMDLRERFLKLATEDAKIKVTDGVHEVFNPRYVEWLENKIATNDSKPIDEIIEKTVTEYFEQTSGSGGIFLYKNKWVFPIQGCDTLENFIEVLKERFA